MAQDYTEYVFFGRDLIPRYEMVSGHTDHMDFRKLHGALSSGPIHLKERLRTTATKFVADEAVSPVIDLVPYLEREKRTEEQARTDKANGVETVPPLQELFTLTKELVRINKRLVELRTILNQ